MRRVIMSDSRSNFIKVIIAERKQPTYKPPTPAVTETFLIVAFDKKNNYCNQIANPTKGFTTALVVGKTELLSLFPTQQSLIFLRLRLFFSWTRYKRFSL